MSNLLEKASIVTTPTAYDNGKILSVKPNTSVGDFDFTRNSSATRVNSQGLIEDVQILSSNLVSNGDFSQEGSEEVTNGNFENNIDGWISYLSTSTWDNGTIKTTATSNAAWIRQNSAVTSNKSYKVTFKAKSSNISPNIKIYNGTTFLDTGLSFDAVDTYKEFTYYLYTTATNIIIGQQDLSVGDTINFDNVSVKEVGQGWTVINGTITDKYNASMTAYQSGIRITPFSKTGTFKVVFDLVVTSGSCKFDAGGSNNAIYSTSGTKEIIVTNTTKFEFNAFNLGWVGTLDNVSVIEITDDTNLPRIDYTGGEGHWLFEPQSTNLITYSSDFSNASYSKANAGLGSIPIVTSDYATSPSGAQDADRIQFNLNSGIAGGDYSWIFTFPASDINGIVSIYLKTNDNSTKVVYFRNTFGTIDNITVTGNWQRYSIANTATRGFYIGLRGGQGNSDTADLSVWGAQVEAQSFATSYIPTNGSTVTRLQDAAFGSGSSDLINSTEGVLYAEVSALANDGTYRLMSLSDGTTTNRIYLGYMSTPNFIRVRVTSGAVTQADFVENLSDTTGFNKLAVKYKENDFALWINGVEVATDTSGLTPITLTDLSFNAGGSKFFGKTKCVAVFKEALTDAELTCLTTI